MERQPLLRDDNSGHPNGSLHPNQFPYSKSSYYDNNYIVQPDRRRPRSATQESGLSNTESASAEGRLRNWKFHRPYFMWLVTLADIIVLVYICAAGKIETIGFKPELQHRSSKNFGYIGSNVSGHDQKVFRYSGVNGFIGPNSSFLVQVGAKFGPCMKKLTKIKIRLENESKKERDFQCCSFNEECGMMANSSCPGVIVNSTSCNSKNPNCSRGVTLRPCCLGLHSQCSIISEQICKFQGGLWHQDKLLCGEVNCLDGICGMSGVKDRAGGHQWYRLITPIFLHLGILHLVMNLFFQVPVGILIEKEIGSIRTCLVYMISGIGGNLLCGIFNPMTPQAGASGALFGLLGLLIVKLLQFRHEVRRPCCELMILLLVVLISFAVGTLPYIGNWVHIGGFLFGLLASIVLLPHVHFGCTNRAAYVGLKCAFTLLLVSLMVASCLVFFLLEDSSFCPWCHYVDCVPYTEHFCPDMNSDGYMD